MKTVQIYDPPMCCSTGVCGPAVDPKLVRFASDLHWLTNHGVKIERYNLSQQPHVFASNRVVRTALEVDGNACLPLLLVDGVVAAKGAYPSREELAAMTGLAEEFASDAAAEVKRPSLPVIQG